MKPFKIFEVNLRQTFNVESMTGIKFQDLKIVYSYKSVEANKYNWNSELVLSGTYPNYTFSAPSEILNTSKIIVFCYEGDGKQRDIPLNTSGTWKTLSTIKGITTITLNSANNHTFNVSSLPSSFNKDKIQIVPLLNSINLSEYDKGYKLDMIKPTSTTYKCNVTSYMYSGTKVTTKYSNRAKTTVNLRDDCVFATVTQTGAIFNIGSSVRIALWEDSKLIYNKSTSNPPYIADGLRIYKDIGVKKSVSFEGEGGAYYFVTLTQHIFDSTPTPITDFEVTCLVLEGT